MAFSTNAIIWEYDSTLSTAITGATAVQADGNFSVDSTNATITEVDNSTLMAKYYKCIVEITFATAPDAASNLEIWLIDTDTELGGADTVQAPSTTAQNGARRVGTVQCSNNTSAQQMTTVIPTFGARKFKLSVYNDAGQSLPIGWTLKVKALADKPVA